MSVELPSFAFFYGSFVTRTITTIRLVALFLFLFLFFFIFDLCVCVWSLSFYNYILTLIGSFALLRIGYKIRSTEIDAKQMKRRIWNTAGQERFRTSTTGTILGQQVSSSY